MKKPCQEGWHCPALSFCQKNFSELKMQKAEHLFFRRCSALLYFFSGSMMSFSTFGLLQVLFAEVFNVFCPRYFATAPCSAEKFFRLRHCRAAAHHFAPGANIIAQHIMPQAHHSETALCSFSTPACSRRLRSSAPTTQLTTILARSSAMKGYTHTDSA